MKIVIVHPELTVRGGAERKALLLRRGLEAKGHQCDFHTFALDKEKSFHELIDDESIILTESAPGMHRLLGIQNQAKKLRDYEAIIASNHPAELVVSLANSSRPQRKIWFCNEPVLYLEDTKQRHNVMYLNVMKIMSARAAKTFDYIVSNSKNTYLQNKKAYGMESVVIYSGIDTSVYSPTNLAKNNTAFLISRLKEHKEIDTLFPIFEKITKTHPNLRLIIGGDGPAKKDLMNRAKKFQANIQFLGRISEEEKLKHYREAKVYVFPTKNEPLGVTPLEAMACGTPVVAFNSGGCKETVEHNKTGFLANTDEEFANYVNKLLSDSKLAKNMGLAGVERVKNIFSVEQMVEKTEELCLRKS